MARTATRKPAADVEETTAKPAAETKGTAWLTDVVNKNLGTNYTGYQVRILIRKLVKAGTIERGEGRYEFTGLRDPRVLAIVKAAKAGGVKEAAAEKVEQAKATSTRSRRKPAPTEEEPAAEAKPTRTRRKPAPKPEPEVEDDDEDDLDLDEL